MDRDAKRLLFLQQPHRRPLPLRRGVSLLPSPFTMGNMFCGYACIVYAMRGDFETAAPFIGIAVVLDMLDGRIARLTGTASDFGVQFDSLADVISFGIAPAILSYAWGMQPLGRLGEPAGPEGAEHQPLDGVGILGPLGGQLRRLGFDREAHLDGGR